MTKAVGYVRPLDPPGFPDPPAPGGGAPDAQRGRIWAWCKAHGHTLEDIHAEAEVPVGDARPALEAALSGAAGGVLVVDAAPCLAGSVSELARVVARVRDVGGRMVVLQDGIDTASDPEGVGLRLLQAAVRLAAVGLDGPVAAPFAFPGPPVTEGPDEAQVDTLLGTAAPPDEAAPPPEADAEAAPAWGDLPIDAGVGGFADADAPADEAPAPAPGADAPETPAPEAEAPAEMRIPLERLQAAVEEAADAAVELASGAPAGDPGADPAPPAGPEAPPPPQSALADVLPVEDHVVPGDGPAAPSPEPAPVSAVGGSRGSGHAAVSPRARQRRESDYAAIAEKASRHLQKGRLDKAASVWTQFLQGADGNNAGRGWNHLGDIHARARRTVEAADCWLKAAEAFETSHYNHMAVATLKKVIRLDPGRPEIYRTLADLNARCDRVGDAVEAYLHYARHLQENQRLAEALEVFGRIRILDPVNARHRMQLADELLQFGFEGEAAREAVHAADLLLERGDSEGAQALLADWSERIPGHAGLSLRHTALAGGTGLTRVPPGPGIPDGVLSAQGLDGRSRARDRGWNRGAPDPAA